MISESFKFPKELYILFISAFIALFIIDIFNLDSALADLIYFPTSSWFYKNAWVPSVLMHKYGKYALILLYLLFFVSFFIRDKQGESKTQRYGKIILLISLLLGTATVTFLQKILEMDCPRDLIRYGGDKPFYDLFQYAQASLPSSHCFPSGHASSAFTWLALYFYATIFYHQFRLKILSAVLILGYLFGVGQQFRGAHFISHDIWSMLVCLFVNVLIYKMAFSHRVIKKVLKT